MATVQKRQQYRYWVVMGSCCPGIQGVMARTSKELKILFGADKLDRVDVTQLGEGALQVRVTSGLDLALVGRLTVPRIYLVNDLHAIAQYFTKWAEAHCNNSELTQ